MNRLFTVKQFIIRAIEIVGAAGIILLVSLMLLVSSEVVSRQIFLTPIKGTIELSKFLMGTLTAFGLSFCALKDGHIGVELVSNFVSKKASKLLDKINYYLVMGFSLILVIQLCSYAMFTSHLGSSSDRLKIPLAPFIYLVAFGFFMMILALVIKCFFKQNQKDE